jgi:endonuclease G
MHFRYVAETLRFRRVVRMVCLMARKPRKPASAKPSARLRPFRRTRAFLWLNLAAVLLTGGWYLFQPPTRQAEVRRLVGNAFEKNKNVSPLDVAWDLYQLYYSPDFVSAPPAAGDRTHLYAGLPLAVSEARTARLLANRGYLVGYSDALANPLWAAYRVVDISPLPAAPERPERFTVDARTVARVEPDAYSNSGYDRGHLAPNYAVATRHGEAAQRETFLMSNVMPQRHGLNAGLWKQLEMRIATSWPARFGEVWVFAGPVFGERPARLGGKGARSAPAIPEACYMIVVDESDGRVRTLAFILPQEPAAGAGVEDFLTTIDEVERRAGLDFLAELPDVAEAELEARRAARVW